MRKTVASETSTPAQQESTKCPHCGNAVELLLPFMGFGDPEVYKKGQGTGSRPIYIQLGEWYLNHPQLNNLHKNQKLVH